MYGNIASTTLGSIGVVAWASKYRGLMVFGISLVSDISLAPVGLANFRQVVKKVFVLLRIIMSV